MTIRFTNLLSDPNIKGLGTSNPRLAAGSETSLTYQRENYVQVSGRGGGDGLHLSQGAEHGEKGCSQHQGSCFLHSLFLFRVIVFDLGDSWMEIVSVLKGFERTALFLYLVKY